jgi:fermentation-respiration switch protein FrsA (DUF1100 family)
MVERIPTVIISDGVPLIGTYLRADAAQRTRQRAIVIGGSWLNVKEQMASLYAEKLAERGFTTFVFDYAGWGQSGGALRNVELPLQKARDLAAVARAVASQSFVEPSRVGFLGVCASAQYGLRALAEGAAFHSFAAVAGWFHDAASLEPFYGSTAGVALRLDRARAALDRYSETGELVTVPAYEPGNDRAGMHFELDYYGNPARGALPSWANQMAEITWLSWLHYDGIAPASSVSIPALLVHGDGCALPDNARLVHSRLAGKKQLIWLEGSQQDFYDQPAQVSAAVEHTTRWFDETL